MREAEKPRSQDFGGNNQFKAALSGLSGSNNINKVRNNLMYMEKIHWLMESFVIQKLLSLSMFNLHFKL